MEEGNEVKFAQHIAAENIAVVKWVPRTAMQRMHASLLTVDWSIFRSGQPN